MYHQSLHACLFGVHVSMVLQPSGWQENKQAVGAQVAMHVLCRQSAKNQVQKSKSWLMAFHTYIVVSMDR